MIRTWLCVIVIAVFSQATAIGQPAVSAAPEKLSWNSGKIVDALYSNECLGFSLPIPDGWELDTGIVGADGKARHVGGGQLTLLFLRPRGNPSSPEIIHLHALDATSNAQSAQDYVSETVHQQAVSIRFQDGRTIEKELLQDASPVEYGGKRFFRAAFKQTGTIYVGFAFTKFRGYFLGGTFVARTQEDLDKSIDSLRQIAFGKDERDVRCVQDSSPAGRVRVSEKVSQLLLSQKVSPQYPHEARKEHIQGPVVLKAEVDTSGNVQDLAVVSGHPLLAPAAIDAVKQWKYKPYLLNGQPVNVETQVTVSFTLDAK